MYVDFNTLSNNSKVWIYQAEEPFKENEIEFINESLKAFCDNWDSHGSPLRTSFEIIENRFIVVSVDQEHGDASGCSIDKSVHAIQKIQDKLGRNLLDKSKVSFQDKNNIQTISFNQIKEAVAEGIIKDETLVYDTSITSMDEFHKHWLTPAKNTWLKRFFSH